MSSAMVRQIGSLLVLVVAGAASLATSQGPGPGRSATENIHVALSAERPYEARDVTVSVKHGVHDANSIWLSVYADEVDSNEYWVALLPRNGGQPVVSWLETTSYQGYDEPFTLTDQCEQDCDASYLVVIGLHTGVDALEADFDVTLGTAYNASYASPLVGASAQVEVSESRADEIGVADLRDSVSGQLIVGPDAAPTWAGTLRVTEAPAVIDGVGLLELRLDADVSDARSRANVAISVDGAWILVDLLDLETPTDLISVQWLEACGGEATCELPIGLETTWEPWPDSQGHIPLTGSVTIDFTFDARLVFVGSTIPSEASLEVRGPSAND